MKVLGIESSCGGLVWALSSFDGNPWRSWLTLLPPLCGSTPDSWVVARIASRAHLEAMPQVWKKPCARQILTNLMRWLLLSVLVLRVLCWWGRLRSVCGSLGRAFLRGQPPGWACCRG